MLFFYLSALGAKGKVAEGVFLDQGSFSSMHSDIN